MLPFSIGARSQTGGEWLCGGQRGGRGEGYYFSPLQSFTGCCLVYPPDRLRGREALCPTQAIFLSVYWPSSTSRSPFLDWLPARNLPPLSLWLLGNTQSCSCLSVIQLPVYKLSISIAGGLYHFFPISCSIVADSSISSHWMKCKASSFIFYGGTQL